MPEEYDLLPFQIDHIIARQHSGKTIPENLALSCEPCNSRKGPNLAGIDPITNEMARLFHPRHDKWSKHFEWMGSELHGISDIGRATIEVLGINLSFRQQLRQALIEEQVFPPLRLRDVATE